VELDGAVGQPPAPVAGTVQLCPGPGAEVVRQKPLGIEIRSVVVTERDARAAQVHFAPHTNRHRLAEGVENVGRGVVHRPADRNRGPVRVDVVDLVADAEGGNLGGAVSVDQLYVRQLVQHLPDVRDGEHVATGHELAQPPQVVEVRVDGEVGQGSHQPQGVDTLFPDGVGHPRWCRHARREQDDPATVEQWAEDFEGAGVEGQRRDLQVAGSLVQLENVGVDDEANDTEVDRLDSLGSTGGAGGVDDVRQVLGGVHVDRVHRGLVGHDRRVGRVVQHDHRGGVVDRCHLAQPALGDQEAGLGVRQHEGEPVGRVGRVQRYVGPTGLEDRHDGHHELKGSFQAEGNVRAASDPA